jgi:hypothetical protein
MHTKYYEAEKAWRERNPDKIKEYQRRRTEKIKQTPELQEKRRGYVRTSVRREAVEKAEHVLWRRTRWRAKRRGLDFNLDVADIIIPDTCPLLGTVLIRGMQPDRENSISLDRIDPSKGYVKGNVEVLSAKANAMKYDASIEELVTFAKNVLTKYQDREGP